MSWIASLCEHRFDARVTVVAVRGKAFSGFKLEDCAVFSGDSVQHKIRWQRDIKELTGKTIRLVFHLKNTKLYSFTVRQRK